MASNKMTFQITRNKYTRLRNWQRFVEEKIRNQEIETGKTWDGKPITEEEMEMLKNGTASVHWGYCCEPYSYEFRPQLPNCNDFYTPNSQYIYGPFVLIRVTNNVTGDFLDFQDVRSMLNSAEWDVPAEDPPWPISMIRMTLWDIVKTFRLLRLYIFGPPKPKGPIELGGIPNVTADRE